MRATAGRSAAVLFLLVCFPAVQATAAVRVVDDEVFFTLKAPGARAVYLVGDFNNWNPTVERMPASGNAFEISLYLVAGSYRYKFVVDGQWIVDPDNPNSDPARGSPIVLVEKPAGLVLLTEDVEEEKKSPSVRPGLRFIGDYRADGGEVESDQQVDFYFRVEKNKLRSRWVLKTVESEQGLKDTEFDVTVDRCFLETQGAGVSVRAFENDSVWTSTGPLGLVGDVGVYRYNAGFGRTGFSVEYPLSEAIEIRALYADFTGADGEVSPPLLRPEVWDDFAAGNGADTTVYYSRTGRGGSDVFGFEAFLDTDAYQLGYARRHNYGLNEGRRLEVTRADSSFAFTLFGTRENFRAAEYWIRVKKFFGFDAAFGFGRGEATVHSLDRGGAAAGPADAAFVDRMRRPDRVDFETEFANSDRYLTSLEYAVRRLLMSAEWQRTSFDFEGGVCAPSSAVVHRGTARARYGAEAWSAACALRYTDQDYGNTPAGLTIDSPSRNFWLDGRDAYRVGDVAALDRASYSDVDVSAEWAGVSENSGDKSRADTRHAWLPTTARLEAGFTAADLLGTLLYRHVRLNLEKVVREKFYVMLDGRTASYGDDVAAGRGGSYVDGYVEIGYRRPHYEVNLGYGFDPVVFDPVLNQYHDNGRPEYLRRSLAGGVRRGETGAVVERLLELEKALEAVNFLKLECVVRF